MLHLMMKNPGNANPAKFPHGCHIYIFLSWWKSKKENLSEEFLCWTCIMKWSKGRFVLFFNKITIYKQQNITKKNSTSHVLNKDLHELSAKYCITFFFSKSKNLTHFSRNHCSAVRVSVPPNLLTDHCTNRDLVSLYQILKGSSSILKCLA